MNNVLALLTQGTKKQRHEHKRTHRSCESDKRRKGNCLLSERKDGLCLREREVWYVL